MKSVHSGWTVLSTPSGSFQYTFHPDLNWNALFVLKLIIVSRGNMDIGKQHRILTITSKPSFSGGAQSKPPRWRFVFLHSPKIEETVKGKKQKRDPTSQGRWPSRHTMVDKEHVEWAGWTCMHWRPNAPHVYSLTQSQSQLCLCNNAAHGCHT